MTDIELLYTHLQSLEAEALEKLSSIQTVHELDAWNTAYLGRKQGKLTELMSSMAGIPKEERPLLGQKVNDMKIKLLEEQSRLRHRLQEVQLAFTLESEVLDVTLPGRVPSQGHMHPLSHITHEVVQIFMHMGFSVADGPEIETDYYNFQALNIPNDHPARDMQDTFWIVPGEILLRTQTSSVQIRFMQEHQPPIRIVVPGKVFRNEDNNATHGAMFHQIEGLLVDKMCTMSDLHGCLERFVHEMFGADRNMRMRGSYFPFTEPSAEVDLSCVCCGNDKACRICKGSGWSEILGCGMVHPNVLREVGYDPQEYRGFAFGMGMDRIAILKYGIDKIGRFTENDLRFLQQF